MITAFRTGKPNQQRPRIIIVKFLSQRAKREIYRARTKLKKKPKDDEAAAQEAIQIVEPVEEDPIIFINEDLTKKRSQFYQTVRDVTIPRKWQAWTENGIIWIRNTFGGPALKIMKKEDLNRAAQTAPLPRAPAPLPRI